MLRMISALVLALPVCTICIAAQAQGSTAYTKPTEGVLLPSPSLTETGDATALSVNPANLAFLDAWNFAYVGSWLKAQQHLAGQGHGLFFAFPLGPLALGLGTEILTPSKAIRDWQGLDDRVRFSLGLALNLQRALSFGLAYRTFWFYEKGDIDTLDLGLTVHPVNYLALSFSVSDVFIPKARDDTNEHAPRGFNVGLTIRPLGTDRLAVGGELRYLDGDDFRRTNVYGLLSAMIVNGVSLRGRFGAEGIRDDEVKTSYFVDGAIAFDLPSFGVGLSMHGQVHPASDRGYEGTTWSVWFTGDEAPSLTLPRAVRPLRAAVLNIEDALDTYSLAQLSALFERLAKDDAVDMLVLRPEPGSIALTEAIDIRRQIKALQSKNREVLCYLKEATGPVYLACSGATRVWINPAGGIRLAGLSSEHLYFGELLSKVGVNADIVRIGEYKSAPEAYMQTGPSDAAREQTDRYFDMIYNHILKNLGADRRLGDLSALRSLVEQGPFTATEALQHGLVDKIVPDDAFEEELRTQEGELVYLDDRYFASRERHRRYVDAPAVAVVHIEGDIVDGESVEVPFIDMRLSGAKTLVPLLRDLGEDRRIQAVVLRIDSPGGSALASDLIWREVMSLRKKKPVIASMGAVAASGAYYIASAANEIFAEATTLTGSIGIFYGKADLSKLLDKIGVDVTTFKRGAHADAESMYRPYTPEERKHLMDQITQYYDLFRDRVVEGRGRGFTREIVDKLGRGRIWSGEDALQHLLVDRLGGYPEAINRARELGRIPEDIAIYHCPVPTAGLLARVIGSVRAWISEPHPLDQLMAMTGFKRVISALFPLAAADSGAPRARLPFVVVQD